MQKSTDMTSKFAYGWVDTELTNAHEFLLNPVLTLVEKYAPKGAGVIEMGCGNGAVASRVAQRGYAVTGFDSSPDGIALARQKWPGLQLHCASIDEPQADVIGTGYELGYSLEVIEHLFQPKNLFLRAKEMIRPGGALILSTPYHGYAKNLALALVGAWDRHLTVDWDGGHIKFFSRHTLTQMAASCGLKLQEFRGVGRLPWIWKSMIAVFALPQSDE